MEPQSVAIAALHRSVDRCRNAPDERFPLDLSRLVDVCRRNSCLAAAVQEIEAEAKRWREEHQAAVRQLVQGILEFRASLAKQFPGIQESAGRERPTTANSASMLPEYLASLAYFDKVVAELGESGASGTARSKLLWILDMQLSGIVSSNPPESAEASAAKKLVAEMQERSNWLERERMMWAASNPGACWLEINDVVSQINQEPSPSWRTLPAEERFKRALELLSEPPVTQLVFGANSDSGIPRAGAQDLEFFREWRSSIAARLERMADEIEYRVASGASRRWALRRYAARSMWFRRVELKEKAEGDSRKAEQILTADAAAYLFDLGFNVVTELTLDTVRLDALAAMGSETLLIEAKVYKDSNRKAKVFDGLGQLLEYAGKLSTGLVTTTNFLLVFRIAGTRLDLPEGPFELNGRTVEIVHVDLAAAEDSGSRGERPTQLTVEAIGEEFRRMPE